MKIDLFTLANWAIVSSLLIVLLLFLRRTKLMKQLSHTLCYALWLPVLLRLLLPGQLFSLPIYPQSGESRIVSESLAETNARGDTAFSESALSAAPAQQGTAGNGNRPDASDSAPAPLLPSETPAHTDARSLAEWIVPVWMGGALVLAVLIAGSNAHFLLFLRRRRTALDDASASLPVYTVEGLALPCLAGLFRPAVYLSVEDAQNPRALRHITAHEESHYLGGDHFWSVLRAAALCLHWYNPLVWCAVVLSKRDAELACDERTLRRLGGDERTAYGETLLSLTMAKPNARNLLSCSTAMVGGKKTLRERIEAIAKSRRTRSAAAFFAVVILAFALVFAFGKQKADEYDEFLQRVEAAERIAYHPPAHSSAYYPAMTDSEIVAEAKEFLSQLVRADERDVPEGELNVFMSDGFSLDGEYRYYFLSANGATLLYRYEISIADSAKERNFTLVGKYNSIPIESRLRELSGAQKELTMSMDEMSEPNAELCYEVKTADGYSDGVDAITSLILKNDSLRAQWKDTEEALLRLLTIQNGGHQLYYGVSSDDLLRSTAVRDHWFLKTVNEGNYAIFNLPDDLLGEMTARFAQYDTNALRFLAKLQTDDISSAVLTVDRTETALENSLRDEIFYSLRTIAKDDALFREVTDESTLNHPVYDFFVTLTMADGVQFVAYPIAAPQKGSVLLSLVSETENRRFVFESERSYYIYWLIFSAAGVGDANDESRGEIYRQTSVAGSETDLEYVARSIGEQIAALWLAAPDETVWKPVDAYLDRINVFDVYYGENGPGRNFCADVGWKMKFDSRFSANYWEAGDGLGELDENGYYSFGLQCLFRIGNDGRWHLAEYGSGGYSVDCGIDLYHDGVIDCEILVKAFFLTEGWTHEYLLPNRFCENPASERAKLSGILDGYSKTQASDFLRAVSDHLVEYPTYHDLTAETLSAELADKYKDFAPLLAAEPFWTGDAGDGRFALYDYGKAEWALLYETGDVREIVATYYRDQSDPNNAITAFVMDDLLGFPGVAVLTDAVGIHKSYDYYALTDYGVQYVAYSFGFYDDPRKEAVSVDLDGDGRSELITTVTYGADGAERVYAFRWNGTRAEVGSSDWSKAGVDLTGIGATNYQENYNTVRGTMALTYNKGNGTKTAELPLTPESFRWAAFGE